LSPDFTRMNENAQKRTLIKNMDYAQKPLVKGEYENTTFSHCSFYGADVSGISFRKCVFEGCDFSLASVQKTAFDDVHFKSCKLLGVRLDKCNDFLLSVDFEDCLLGMTVFVKLPLKNTRFKNCNLQEADFAEADLSGAIFDNCDLTRTVFSHTNLQKADFRSAFGYSLNPMDNRIKKARFSTLGIIGLLDSYDIIIE